MGEKTTISKDQILASIGALMILFFFGFIIWLHFKAWQVDKYFYLLDKEGVKTTAKVVDNHYRPGSRGVTYYLTLSYKTKNGGEVNEQKERVEVSHSKFEIGKKKGRIPILYLPNQPKKNKIVGSVYPDNYLFICTGVDICLLFMVGVMLYIWFFK